MRELIFNDDFGEVIDVVVLGMLGSGYCRKRRVEFIVLGHVVGQSELLFLRYAHLPLASGGVCDLFHSRLSLNSE